MFSSRVTTQWMMKKKSEQRVKWSQENGESMWVSVPEQKSQIKIEQQPCDDSVTVKHLQRRDREKERGSEGDRYNGM